MFQQFAYLIIILLSELFAEYARRLAFGMVRIKIYINK